ncbi:hypothetical protein HPB48_017603 [Haemaphysalis longicornis]|uniref:GH18 domain-containing protein n=1 Tax=Haemaphysalis longicornis TaxID=44386 RepID=A0A9J6GY75_HAELO|nr:hypothetical protein HPB48_017603 [Haemaphysalis longicornis]
MRSRRSSSTPSDAAGVSPGTGPLNASLGRQGPPPRSPSLSVQDPGGPSGFLHDVSGANRATDTHSDHQIPSKTHAESSNPPSSGASSEQLSSPVPCSAYRRGRSTSRNTNTGSSRNRQSTSLVGQIAEPSSRCRRLSSVARETIPSVVTQPIGQKRGRRASLYDPWRRRSSTAPDKAARDYPHASETRTSGRQSRASSMAAETDPTWGLRLRSSTTGEYSPPTGLLSGASGAHPQTTKGAVEDSHRLPPTPSSHQTPQGSSHAPSVLNVDALVVPNQRASLPSNQRYQLAAGILPTAQDPPVDNLVALPPVEELSLTCSGQTSSFRTAEAAAAGIQPRSREASPALDSLPLPTADVNYGDQQPGGRFCMQFWFLCSASAIIVGLPLLLLWLSYYVTPGAKRLTAGSSPTYRNHSISISSPTLGPTRTRASSPTLDSTRSPTGLWTSPPQPPLLTTEPLFLAGCGGEVLVHVPVVVKAVNAVSAVNFTEKPKLQNTFCIYNNTRVDEIRYSVFLPEHMPLTYCRHIVYWSLKVLNGTVGSRMPDFDGAYGLSKLRNLTVAAGNPSAIILAAVGGYPEESREFSLLGRDPDSMVRFVTSVREIVSDNQLTGIAIHWVAPEPRCVDPNATDTLKAIVAAIRNDLNVTIAVFLPADANTSLPVWNQISPLVDYAFVETPKLNPANGFDLTMCDKMSQLAARILAQFAGPHDEKICAGVSLAPWLVNGISRGTFTNMTLVSKPSQGGTTGTGRGPLFKLCKGGIGLCKAPTKRNECIVLGKNATWKYDDLYLFPDLPSLYTIVARGKRFPSDINEHCLVLYDVDVDVSMECSLDSFEKDYFISLRHLIQAIDAPQNESILRSPPNC